MNRYPPAIVHPPRASLPVLLSVPHSGRDYDAAVLANAAQGRLALEMLEDPLVDRLAWRAISAGVGAIVQPVARAVIDCNRDEGEVDPAAIRNISPGPVGPRARYGLGLVPSRTHRHGALWRQPIDRDELARRLEEVHRPYHELISAGLTEMTARFDEVLLIDCHSMPTRASPHADIVIGDRHGATAANWVTAETTRIARSEGFRVALNDPYAGGAIVARHGRPAEGVHALQVEIDRSCYLDRDGRTPGAGFDRTARLLERLALHLGEALAHRAFPAAAE